LTSETAACRLLGKSRATLHRQRNPKPERETGRPPPQRAAHPAALTREERDQALAVLDSERFADKSPAQAWAVLLDEGCYLCSIRTMYRILKAEGQVRERRAQAAHPPRVRPELVASGPGQVWTWDITKLKGPWRGTYFDLYVMIDIFSRKAIRWEVHPTETGDLAKEFIENAIAGNGGARPDYIHADNGTSMTSKSVSQLLSDLSITRSHSRPHVSNDNPYSESAFKTLKYCPVFPWSSPAASLTSKKPAHSATSSSPTTTTTTATPASGCTLPPRSTTAQPGPSRHTASRSSTMRTPRTPAGSRAAH
jgi:transposase InsO family protein